MKKLLRPDVQRAVGGDKTVGHTRSVEGGGGMTLAVEEYEPAGRLSAVGEFADAGIGDSLGDRERAAGFAVGRKGARIGKKIDRHFGHDDFHDALAVAGAGNTANGGVGIAAATNERRIADAAG